MEKKQQTYELMEWEENTLQALYAAFAISEEEGRAFFLNSVFENYFKNPSFLTKVYQTISEIQEEGIFEVSASTLEWVEFWQSFNNTDREKHPKQLEKLYTLLEQDFLTLPNMGYLYFHLAFIENELGDPETSATLYEKSVAFLPKFSWTYNNWGNCLGDLGASTKKPLSSTSKPWILIPTMPSSTIIGVGV